MIIYKNITNKTQMILYITILKEKTMKFLQTNKMKIIYLSISTCMIAIGLGIRYYISNYKVPFKEYTASCLYIAVMDDEIARLRFENQVMNGKKVEFPPRIESLQYRYHLHLQLQKGKTRHEFICEPHYFVRTVPKNFCRIKLAFYKLTSQFHRCQFCF